MVPLDMAPALVLVLVLAAGVGATGADLTNALLMVVLVNLVLDTDHQTLLVVINKVPLILVVTLIDLLLVDMVLLDMINNKQVEAMDLALLVPWYYWCS